MKYLFICALLPACISSCARPSIEQIKQTNPSKVQVIFEVERHPNIEPELWQYLVNCMLDLYTPSLNSDDQLDDWMTRFNDMIKKVALVSVKTNKTQGRLTFRFVTD